MAGNSYLESINAARQLVQDHLADWNKVDAKVASIVEKAQKIGSVTIDSGSIKELNAKIQENVALRKQMNDVVTQHEAKIKSLQTKLDQLNKTRKTNSKALTDEERQLKTLQKSEERLTDVKSKHWRQIEMNRKAANETAQATRNSLTTYGAYSQKLIALTRTYKDLAIRKAQLNNLTEDEVANMNRLETEITQLRGKLVQVDHSVGQFGRSVGSYGKQFDSLGFSVAQMTRELPAFAYGAQIGFAALSNNIPIFVDEIAKARREVKALRAEGKATEGTLMRFGKAMLSWQTLLSVGITLSVFFADELSAMAAEFFNTADASEQAKKEIERINEETEKYIETLDDLNKAMVDGSKSAQGELAMLNLLDDVVKDVNRSQEDRKKALDELRSEYPEYLKNMSDEEIYAEGIGEAYAAMAKDILNAAQSKAAFDRIVENSEAVIDLSTRIGGLNSKLTEYQKVINSQSYAEYVAKQNEIKESMGRTSESTSLAIRQLEYLAKQYPKEAEAARENVKVQDELNEIMSRRGNILEDNERLADSITSLDDILTDSTKKGTEAKRDDIEALQEMNMVRKYSVDYYEQIISALTEEQSKVSKASSEWKEYQKAIDEAADAIRIIKDIQGWAGDELSMPTDELDAFNEKVTEALTKGGIEKGMQGLSEVTGETLDDLYRQFTQFYGDDFESFMEFYNAKMEKREEEKDRMKELQQEIADAAVEFGSALFEAEIERINQKIEANRDFYAMLLNSAELTEERRSALEAERDAKERKLLKEKRKRENEQFLFEQGVALAKVAMHTAVGIAEALPNLALATLVGILGAIQAATIIAQSIPKFEKGTDNAPAGWAIVDEVTPEVHTDRYGRVKSYGSEKGANLRFLEQGDRIYTSREKYFKEVGYDNVDNAILKLNMKHQGGSMSKGTVDNALLREMMALRGENARAWKELKRLASRPINNHIKLEMPDNQPY